jgi:hypothetical protein
LGSLITRHPREFVAGLMATAAVFAIFANALFMQSGPHPAPIFSTRPLLAAAPPAAPPRPRMTEPVPAASPSVDAPQRNRVQLIADIQRELTRRGYYDGTADGVWGAKTDAGARDFLQAVGCASIRKPATNCCAHCLAPSRSPRMWPRPFRRLCAMIRSPI